MDKNTVELDFWEPENEKDTPEKAFVDGKLVYISRILQMYRRYRRSWV